MYNIFIDFIELKIKLSVVLLTENQHYQTNIL